MVKISYTSALLALASCALVNSFSASASASDKRPNVAELLGKVPLRFEQNQGQLHPEAAYQARGAGYAIALDRQGGAWVHLETPSRDKASEFRIGLRHANSAPVIEPVDAEQTAFHYLRGADRSHWRSSIRAYGKVRYRDVYPGIDLVYYLGKCSFD